MLPMQRMQAHDSQQQETSQTKKVSWEGWYFEGEYLFDDAGNQYDQYEIRAIFYTHKIMRELREELAKLKPPPAPREPVQLTLGFEPAYKLCRHWNEKPKMKRLRYTYG